MQDEKSPPELKTESLSGSKPMPIASPTPEATTESKPIPPPALSMTPTSANTINAPVKKAETTSPPTPLPTSQDTSKKPLSVGQLNAKAVRLPKPLYPETARRMRIVGAVAVQVTVDESGKVIAARAVNGHVMLRDAATAAARQAKFIPVLISGQPVPVSGFITYTFSL
ncbi:MAG: TonB family protein, partial [Acidobacteria bacterium]|nr:TonB family protein [Acidobacteriota bacterium]